ncbi:MAG: hypothetical protein BGO98_46680 [Myxococcales bacterium 68-20]|nr:MAG: hypothetical protein BGO98_46680 [Myxococcales bacterium 68-20]
MEKTSAKSVLAALAANAFVATLKLVAFAFSGSASMLSEAIHSLADTGNQVLLFVGLRRSARQPDREHHYGYGGEQFVFGLLSASGVFFIGCGVTVYHGIMGVLSPREPNLGPVTFVVLGASLLVEGAVLVYAVRTSLRTAGSMPYLKYLRRKADPATLAVLLEDGVAVFGLLLATAGIGLTYWTKQPIWDSVGSILVGLLLGGVALFLVIENRGLLLGKAAPPEIEAKFADVLRSRLSVHLVRDVKSRQLTPAEYILKAEITFAEDFIADRLEEVAPREPDALSGAFRRSALRAVASAATRVVAEEIDAIEDAVRAAIPEAKHIDLEVDRGLREGGPHSRRDGP